MSIDSAARVKLRISAISTKACTAPTSSDRIAPSISIALDAREGHGRAARFAYKEELDIPRDADIATIGVQEIERNRSIAMLFSENEPNGTEFGGSYEILYLAKPLLETLPNA